MSSLPCFDLAGAEEVSSRFRGCDYIDRQGWRVKRWSMLRKEASGASLARIPFKAGADRLRRENGINSLYLSIPPSSAGDAAAGHSPACPPCLAVFLPFLHTVTLFALGGLWLSRPTFDTGVYCVLLLLPRVLAFLNPRSPERQLLDHRHRLPPPQHHHVHHTPTTPTT